MIYKLQDKITFGKYSERDLPIAMTIEEIISQDPEYLVWCLDNVDSFELDSQAESMLDDATMVWDDLDPWDNGGHPLNFGDR